jgi:hypothetical protein
MNFKTPTTNYTNKAIHLHSKCLGILEMIKRVNNRIEERRSKIHLMDNSDWLSPVNLMNTRTNVVYELAHYHQVKKRLVSYYCNTMLNLITPAIEAGESMTVNINNVNVLKAAI